VSAAGEEGDVTQYPETLGPSAPLPRRDGSGRRRGGPPEGFGDDASYEGYDGYFKKPKAQQSSPPMPPGPPGSSDPLGSSGPLGSGPGMGMGMDSGMSPERGTPPGPTGPPPQSRRSPDDDPSAYRRIVFPSDDDPRGRAQFRSDDGVLGAVREPEPRPDRSREFPRDWAHDRLRESIREWERERDRNAGMDRTGDRERTNGRDRTPPGRSTDRGRMPGRAGDRDDRLGRSGEHDRAPDWTRERPDERRADRQQQESTRERSRERGRDRERDRGQDRARGRGQDRERERNRDRERSGDRDIPPPEAYYDDRRGRGRDHAPEHDLERDVDQDLNRSRDDNPLLDDTSSRDRSPRRDYEPPADRRSAPPPPSRDHAESGSRSSARRAATAAPPRPPAFRPAEAGTRSAPRPEGVAAHPVRRRSRAGEGARPDRKNQLALAAAFLGAALVLFLFWTKTPGLSFATSGEAYTTVGDGLGMLTAYLLMVQVLLMARIPWLERGIGSDRLTAVHRFTGETLVCVLIAHVSTITIGYSDGMLSKIQGELPTLFLHTEDVLIATIGTGILVLTGLISLRAVRRRIPYEIWYYLHLGVYAAIALAFMHQIVLGPTFEANDMARMAWTAAYILVAAMVLIHRVGGPLRLAYRHRLVVTRVEPEGPDAVSIYLGGRQLRKLNAEPGQFFRWRFLAKGAWWQAHPFSLSAAPNREWLRITVGALGNHSTSLQNIRPGTRVLAEGPYGAFTAALRTRGKVLLLAGGIGITPLRALVDALASVTRDIVLVYRASDRQSIVFGEELDYLDRTGQLELHYLLGPRDSSPTPLSAERLSDLIPDVADRDVFLCGPPGMIDSARRALREAGVPGRRMHHERFST
jgi:predicted ferric reductase